MDWQGRRVLVTGATGFIGGHLARRLAELGAEVHPAGRRQADLRDAGAAARLVRQVAPDVVFHLAGQVDGARDPGVVRPTLDGNLVATVNLLDAVVRSGCRVVLAGSSEEPRPGNGHCPPPSPYAMAKAAASGYAELYRRLWDLPYTIVRPTMVYGPGQRDTSKVVPYVTLALLRGATPRLTSGAKPVDWVYVEDVAEAFALAGASERAVGAAFDVGTGTTVPVREAVGLLYRIAGEESEPPFGSAPDRPLDVPQAADPGPARELLGWEARVLLEEGLRRTVAWFSALRA
ncbi:NAD-dependent epimerase/dehydratase family protein [Nonomuraea pusilla]|uniref:Nucleoside-diphosphate-sugar epimerase n=1 Tax=Nonomuraea pusilla TaxID=46177 RepID=A0A1H7R814_9ACTN|nr:NAD-dependent epimerase/dehydratase family protein [Nonomuraea pusilla]SEL56426.1 Nucleoside-diphosphate-sugar epimerase [Nonomuraea pusilla]